MRSRTVLPLDQPLYFGPDALNFAPVLFISFFPAPREAETVWAPTKKTTKATRTLNGCPQKPDRLKLSSRGASFWLVLFTIRVPQEKLDVRHETRFDEHLLS